MEPPNNIVVRNRANVFCQYRLQRFIHNVNSCLKTNNGKRFKWDCIYNFARMHMNDLREPRKANYFFNCLTLLVFKYNCSDPYLLTQIINYQVPRKSRMNRLILQQKASIRYLRAKHYEGIKTICSFGPEAECSKTASVIHDSDLTQMKVLVKYGLSDQPPRGLENEWEIADNTVSVFFSYVKQELGEELQHRYNRPRHHPPPPSQLHHHHVSENKDTRFLLTLKGIEAITRQAFKPVFLARYVECLNLYFDTIPEPFTAKTEVFGFLQRDAQLHDKPEFLQLLWAAYLDLFPRATTNQEPRSLKHLSRCKVRETFRQFGILPDVIEKLHIPAEVKKYVLCV